MKEPLRAFVWCDQRKRRAMLHKGRCQYCRADSHKPYTGGFFDLPGLD